jgi:hypothetical protein
MKTLLSILARNIYSKAKMITEAYLRRAAHRQGAKSLDNRRHSLYAPQFRAGRTYFKHRR